MPTPSDRDREVAADVISVRDQSNVSTPYMVERCAQEIAQARQEGYKAGVEACAKKLHGHAEYMAEAYCRALLDKEVSALRHLLRMESEIALGVRDLNDCTCEDGGAYVRGLCTRCNGCYKAKVCPSCGEPPGSHLWQSANGPDWRCPDEQLGGDK